MDFKHTLTLKPNLGYLKKRVDFNYVDVAIKLVFTAQ